MKVVHIAGPFRGKSHWDVAENIRTAERLALEVWRLGAVALCPHANSANFQDAAPDKVFLEGDLELLRRCDAIIMTPNWERSKGATAERYFAVDHQIPIFHEVDDLGTWIRLQECEAMVEQDKKQ